MRAIRQAAISGFALALAGAPIWADPPPPTPHGETRSLQNDADWRRDPHIKAFYDLSVEMLGPGKTVDRAAYQARAQEIFKAFAIAQGINPAAMQDHLKAIPGQMIDIVRDDPKTLASLDAFIIALFGPQ